MLLYQFPLKLSVYFHPLVVVAAQVQMKGQYLQIETILLNTMEWETETMDQDEL